MRITGLLWEDTTSDEAMEALMSATIKVDCDAPMEGGTCAAHVVVLAYDLTEARRLLPQLHRGWVSTSGRDLCPAHSGRRDR